MLLHRPRALTHVYIHSHTYIHLHTFVHTHTCPHTRTHIHTHKHTFPSLLACCAGEALPGPGSPAADRLAPSAPLAGVEVVEREREWVMAAGRQIREHGWACLDEVSSSRCSGSYSNISCSIGSSIGSSRNSSNCNSNSNTRAILIAAEAGIAIVIVAAATAGHCYSSGT